MAWRCDTCGKGPATGNTVSHANNKHRTRNLPNLHAIKALVHGSVKRIKICTRCLRSNVVQKAA